MTGSEGTPRDGTEPPLVVEGVRVGIVGTDADIVDDVSFSVDSGEVLGLVGESGSGKTTVGLAVLGHTRRGASIVSGSVRVAGDDLTKATPAELRSARGRTVSYVPQDPAAALNPAIRVGAQLREILEAHDFGGSGAAREERMREVLEEVLLPADREFMGRYPHQLSGGQQQRVALAMAFACRPRVVVLDEPTTGLDVVTQDHILETVGRLASTHGVAAVYISHDIAVVASVADRTAVMYGGRLVELGPTGETLYRPAHPYTRALVEAIPDVSEAYVLVGLGGSAPSPGHRPGGCFFAPRCPMVLPVCRETFPPSAFVDETHRVRCHRWQESVRQPARKRTRVERGVEESATPLLKVRDLAAWYGDNQVLSDISFDALPFECLALVGESGSGKTTLARCLAGLHENFTGDAQFNGERLAPGARNRTQELRREVQYVFQSPYNSLNPRRTIGEIVGMAVRQFLGLRGKERRARVAEALDRVSLGKDLMGRYPDQLSGGERQRVAIARAIVGQPSLLVCDEVTSALDVSVQATIVELLAELRRELEVTMLFITHDLALVRSIADRIGVLSDGRLVELGRVHEVLDAPAAAETRDLLQHTRSLDAAAADNLAARHGLRRAAPVDTRA